VILERMATQLALAPSFLTKLARSASHRYKEYKIPKRTGGERTIHHPAREIKLLQYWLLKNVLISLPVHPSATAYRKESSIRLNAVRHVANNYLLRVDFQDFFPSLSGSDVVAVLAANRRTLTDVELTDADITLIRQIVCRFDCLTIGAPTSPLLSNAIMFEFDVAWSGIAQAEEVTYTRYADDLYFSTNQPNVLQGILGSLRESVNAGGVPTLRINDRKTAFSSRKRRRLAAGLVLTSDRKISIGRVKKRRLKALVNNLKHKQLEPEQIAHLRGWIAYLRSVEPTFVLALQRKYELDFSADPTWEMDLGNRR
jgi:RNA-directed DNA polymerase